MNDPARRLWYADRAWSGTVVLDENVPLDEVVRAAEWYAWLPRVLAQGEK